MQKVENEKIYRIILAVFTAFNISIIALFCFFCIGLSKVDAASYDFATPRTHNICPTNILGYCSTSQGGVSTTDSRTVGAINNQGRGNYINVNYRADMNTTNVSGNTYIAGKYQVEFRYRIYLTSGNDLSTNVIKTKLIYYPDSNSQYNIATCDGEENVTVTKGWDISDISYRTYDIHYTCSTLKITEGKQFLGWHIELDVDDPFGVAKYIQYGEVEQNLKLTGEGEATNNDIIHNQNQNTQDIINNATQNTDKIIGALEGEGLEDTTPINPDKKNELEEVEEGLLNEDIITSINDIDISIDTNSNEFIWNLVTRIINTHSLIFGLVLTMLSLGVLKLVLNR